MFNKTILAIISLALIIFACNPKDTVSPKIYLNGGDTTIILESTYHELGYIAEDNKDRIITDKVTISIDDEPYDSTDFDWPNKRENVNPGYILKYTVKDEAGNTGSAERAVFVENEAAPFAIEYDMERINLSATGEVGLEFGPGTANPNREKVKIQTHRQDNNRLILKDLALLDIEIYIDIENDSIIKIDQQEYIANDTTKYTIAGIPGQSLILNKAPGTRKLKLEYKIEKFKKLAADESFPIVTADSLKGKAREIYTERGN